MNIFELDLAAFGVRFVSVGRKNINGRNPINNNEDLGGSSRGSSERVRVTPSLRHKKYCVARTRSLQARDSNSSLKNTMENFLASVAPK